MSFSTTFKPFDPLAPLPFKSLKSLETALNLEDVPIEQTSEKVCWFYLHGLSSLSSLYGAPFGGVCCQITPVVVQCYPSCPVLFVSFKGVKEGVCLLGLCGCVLACGWNG